MKLSSKEKKRIQNLSVVPAALVAYFLIAFFYLSDA